MVKSVVLAQGAGDTFASLSAIHLYTLQKESGQGTKVNRIPTACVH